MNESCPKTLPNRRGVLKLLASSLALMSTTGIAHAQPQEAAAASAIPFSFDLLTEEMRAAAGRPHEMRVPEMPDFVKNLDYDSYRLIQFRRDRAKWAETDSLYQIHAFHPGWLFKEPVQMFEVDGGTARPMLFSEADFEYLGDVAGVHGPQPLPGVAGFRINTPLNAPNVFDELVAFLGASYFRALGRGNIYGLSARGLVINSWQQGPEEFPRFSRFYLEKPQGDGPIVVNAALESESVTGAYRFEITAGEETVMEVTARLFFRKDVAELGVAPLTSMFLYAQANRSQFDDYRPQVHDSNGLFIERDTGETMWRALNNPPALGNSYFSETNPRVFGLHQRDRDFEHYQDAGAHYERRPSLNVEPIGDWGAGRIRLIEVPSKLEAEDNIVAFWVPEEPVKAGDEREFRYRLRWGDIRPETSDFGYVAETRAGRGGVSGVDGASTLRKFVVDFEGGILDTLDANTQLDIAAGVSGANLVFSTVSRIDANGRWRLVLDVEVTGTEPVELRAYLAGLNRKLTETWLYQWRAEA